MIIVAFWDLKRRLTMEPNFKLKQLRFFKKLKQTDMAEILGIGGTTYNRKENGIVDFTETEIRNICKYFNVSPMDIFFDDLQDNQY